MKNNNLLITVAIICIAIAGLGWFVTGQATSAPEAQRDQLVTTPLASNKTTDSIDHSSRQTDYKGNHHSSNGQHCADQSID